MRPATSTMDDARTDPKDGSRSTSTTASSTWYDPDASAWEPQPPALFESLRATPASPSGRADGESSREGRRGR